jgi:rhamnogalacturonan endolyase
VGNNKKARRSLSLLLTAILFFSNWSIAFGADLNVSGTAAEAGGAPILISNDTVFQSVYSTDFGDSVPVEPVNWGFTTSNATVSVNTYDVGGNNTPKLQFTQANQSGGRVATKTFASTIKGERILVKFDWYPGKVNDKGANNPSENGGEFRIMDSSGNIVFTLNNTNNAPLKYFAGKQPAMETAITNPQGWYTAEVTFDIRADLVTLKLTHKATGAIEVYSSSLYGVAFDGSVASVRLVGMRTSGNNITWTTYLDNFGVYHLPIPDNRITKVDKLPYHKVYVNTTTEAVSSIGLPQTVKVTLANNSKADLAVREWTAVNQAWSPGVSGVYQFRGALVVPEGLENGFERYATCYVYNRLAPSNTARQTEWLDRGVVALKSNEGVFISWRLLADEYSQDVKFNLYRNGQKLNAAPLAVTNFVDAAGTPGDIYQVETIVQGVSAEMNEKAAASKDYLSIPMQKPEGGTTATGSYTYQVNDSSVGDLDGDGEYEIIVKWYPTNAIDSSQSGMTGPTIFDAYKMDGTLLWRINMGLNLTSGAHYHQFVVADFDGDGRSEFLIKTADATTVYGTANGLFDSSKVISVIGNPEDNGKWVNEIGHAYGGPEYISVFRGDTGEVIDTVNYAFPLGDVLSWGDTWYNRSDRFLAGLAYLDGVSPSAIYGRGYYERTTYAAYSLVNGKLQVKWTFDSAQAGRGAGLGFHSLATGDVDNDGFDELVAGSLTLDHDGTILYAMDGEMGREPGSHGDALHLGAFDPAREGLQVMAVHEVPAVPSVELHDAGTGETLMSFNAYMDTGRGLAANITSGPGYEFWGTGGNNAATGGGIYNVQGQTVANSFRTAGLSVNFALFWDGDLLHELLDNTSITKYNQSTGTAGIMKSFDGVVSNNGTKATPTLQADILGDWREEVLLPAADSTELRIFSTTIPTEYRLYTLMHDPVYRNAAAWQNTAYNQPPHIGFYLGEDIRAKVLAGELQAPTVAYTNKPATKTRLSGAAQVRRGDELSLQYGLANVNLGRAANVQTAVYAQDLTLAFDPNALEFAGAVSLKPGIAIVGTETGISGKVRILLAGQGAVGAIIEDSDILKLTWNVKLDGSADSTDVVVERAMLANGLGEMREALATGHHIALRPDVLTLEDVIDASQMLYDHAVEGIGAGQYYPGTKGRFLTALNAAKAVAADLNAEASQITAAKAALLKAKKAFQAATGDLTGDGSVNIGDLGLVAANYGKESSHTDWSNVEYIDMDANGRIGLEELTLVARKILIR